MKFSQDQNELKDTLRQFLTERVNAEYRLALSESDSKDDPNLLREFEGLGILDGFVGQDALFDFIELCIISHEFGRVLVDHGVLDRILSAWLLRKLDTIEREKLTPLLSNKNIALVPKETHQCTISGEMVSGAIDILQSSPAPECVLLNLSSSDERERIILISLHDPAQLQLSKLESLDRLTSLSSLTLDPHPFIELSDRAAALFLRAKELVTASGVAGLCERVVELTTEYVKTREQFGVAIGSFQGVQHALADILLSSEALTALTQFGAWCVQNSPEQVNLVSRAAALKAGSDGVNVCEKAIQLHGGIGFTWEYELHLYLRRALTINVQHPSSSASSIRLLEAATSVL